MLCSVPFPPCRRPVFLFLNLPTATTYSSVFLTISDYVFNHCLANYANNWTLKWAPGNKFLRLLGSLCARAHPENHIESSESKSTEPRWRKNYHPCTPIMYGGPLEIYDWWLIDPHPHQHVFLRLYLPDIPARWSWPSLSKSIIFLGCLNISRECDSQEKVGT